MKSSSTRAVKLSLNILFSELSSYRNPIREYGRPFLNPTVYQVSPHHCWSEIDFIAINLSYQWNERNNELHHVIILVHTYIHKYIHTYTYKHTHTLHTHAYKHTCIHTYIRTFLLQKKAMKMITFSIFDEHSIPLFKHLNIF